MKDISKKTQLLIGVAMFSMFFGAGNLIFPPLLGYQSGTNSLLAFIGFAVSAIGFPILGVIAVSRKGDLLSLAGNVGKTYAAIYAVLAYMAIGPLLAIPRNGATSFNMMVQPFLPEDVSPVLIQLAYTVVFYAVALFLALRPNKLVDLLGKRMAPALLILVAILFVTALISGLRGGSEPVRKYAEAPFTTGFLGGYQTMDAIAALVFGSIVISDLHSRGVKEDKPVLRVLIRAGLIAGSVFAAVYGILTWLGTVSVAASASEASNGATLLSYIAKTLLGPVGQVILGAIFVIACLNTCVTLICSCAKYFGGLFPKVSYTVWCVIFAMFALAVSNFGLNLILEISVPILNCIYPPAILMILLAFVPRSFAEKRRLLFPIAVGVASFFSVLAEVAVLVKWTWLSDLLGYLPLASSSLGWITPALLGVLVGCLIVTNPKQSV